MKRFSGIVVLLFLSFGFSVAQNIGRYMEHGYLTNQFKSKTAFFWAHPMHTLLTNDLMNVSMGNRTCTAVHANLVSRHAARYTSVDTMRDFTKLHEKIKNAYANQNYYFIDRWTNIYPEEKKDMVTQLGGYEMEYLGKMYGTRLNDLFKPGFHTNGSFTMFTDRLKFAATHKTRTQTSANFFCDRLSAVVTGFNITQDHVPIRDHVLRFYDDCKSYELAASDKQEMVKFEKGPYFQKVIHNIAEKLHLNTTLTAGMLVYTL